MPRPSYVVIGFGVSAAVAAISLRERLGPDARIEIMSEQDEPTVAFENTFETTAHRVKDFINDNLYFEIETRQSRGSYLERKGKLVQLTGMSRSGVPLSNARKRSLGGHFMSRWSLDVDTLFPRPFEATERSTVAEITRARVGKKITEQLVTPIVLARAGATPDVVNAERFDPQLRRAAAEKRPLAATLADWSDNREYLSVDCGVSSFSGYLFSIIDSIDIVDSINTKVTAIRRSTNDFYSLEVDGVSTTTPANAVVLSSPPKLAAAQTAALEGLAGQLDAIDVMSMASVTFTIKTVGSSLPADADEIFLAPRPTDGLPTVRRILVDRVFDRTFVRVDLGVRSDTEFLHMSDTELIDTAIMKVVDIIGLEDARNTAQVTRCDKSVAHLTYENRVRVEAARKTAASYNIALAGSCYDGITLGDLILSGLNAADQFLAQSRS